MIDFELQISWNVYSDDLDELCPFATVSSHASAQTTTFSTAYNGMHMVVCLVLAFITGSIHIRVLRSVQASMKVGLVSTIRRILQYKHTHTHTYIHSYMDTPHENAAIQTNGRAQCSVSSTQNYI